MTTSTLKSPPIQSQRKSAQSLLVFISQLWISQTVFAQNVPTAGNHASLDLYIFSQQDRGGNPYRTEAFDYGAAGGSFRVEVSDEIAIRANVVGGYIANEEQADLTRTVQNATTTSASQEITTLDAAGGIDYKNGDWTYSPGLYYHHQNDFYVSGLDLAAKGELFDGNSILYATYSFRHSYISQDLWSGREPEADYSIANNVLISWSQVLSPSWLLSTSLQLTRQDGLLSSRFNYVTSVNSDGSPRWLSNENLPRTRHRAQFNVRARYSPKTGTSLGLDTSYYLDDWGIHHGGLEPSVEFPITDSFRLRIWYRMAIQHRTRYFRSDIRFTTPADAQSLEESGTFRTQDSDLNSFVLHSPGIIATFPLYHSAKINWSLRLSVFGFYRNDGLFAGGSNTGIESTW